MSGEVKYPDVTVQLRGRDGNAFVIIGAVCSALRRAGHADAASEFSAAAVACGGYDELLILALQTVRVT